MKKARVTFASLCLAVLLAGCLGPNALTNNIRNWNATVTENEWYNEGIFVLISPVYPLAWLGDVLVFNSLRFWTGEEMVYRDPGAYPKGR